MNKEVLSLLDAREKDFPFLDSSQYSYKLAGGSYGHDVPVAIRDLDIDEKTMSLWIPVCDGNRRDGVGDLLDVLGIDTSRHKKNPICLLDHGKQIPLPIARAREDPKDEESYTFRINPGEKTAGCRAYFYQGKENCDEVLGCKQFEHGILCHQLFHMAANGFLNSGSIGYQIISADPLPEDPYRGIPRGMHLQRILALENSLVVLPASQDTVGKSTNTDVYPYSAKHLEAWEYTQKSRICGSPPSPYLIKAFSSFAPPHKAQVVGGYDSKGMRTIIEDSSGNPRVTSKPLGKGGVEDTAKDLSIHTKSAEAILHGKPHPPGCKCAKCIKELPSKKSCSCDSCSKGHSCPCDTKTKGVKDLENQPASALPEKPTTKPVPTSQSAPGSPQPAQQTKTPKQAANVGQQTPRNLTPAPAPVPSQQQGQASQQASVQNTPQGQIINPVTPNAALSGLSTGAVEIPQGQQIPLAPVPTFNPAQPQRNPVQNTPQGQTPPPLPKPKYPYSLPVPPGQQAEQAPQTSGPPPLTPERLAATQRTNFNPKNLHLKKVDYSKLTPEQATKKATQAALAAGANKKQAQQIAKQVVEQMKRMGNRQHRQQRNARWTPQGPKSLDMNFHIKSLRSKYGKKSLPNTGRKFEATPDGSSLTPKLRGAPKVPGPKPVGEGASQTPPVTPKQDPTFKPVKETPPGNIEAYRNVGDASSGASNNESREPLTEGSILPEEGFEEYQEWTPESNEVGEEGSGEAQEYLEPDHIDLWIGNHVANLVDSGALENWNKEDGFDASITEIMDQISDEARAEGFEGEEYIKIMDGVIENLRLVWLDTFGDWGGEGIGPFEKSLRSKYVNKDSKKEKNPPARRNKKTANRHMAAGINSALDKSAGLKHLGVPSMNIGNIGIKWLDKKSLLGLRDKYKTAKGRLKRHRKGSPSKASVHVSSKDLDKLRKDAESKGVAVKWRSDDGKGMAKVLLEGDGGVIEKLANAHGKLRKKSLMGSEAKDFTDTKKPLGPIGTLPGTTPSRERETLQEAPLTEGELSTERPGEPEATDVLTAHKEEKNMKVKTKAADPLTDPNMPLPEEGTEDSLPLEGNPDLGATDEMGGDLGDEEDLGDMGGDEFDMGGLDEGPEAGGLGEEGSGEEPYGMQVMRRLWDDTAGLLHEYDQFMEHLEDEATRGLLQSMLEYLSSHLERLESHVASHPRYGEFPGLGGEEGEEGAEGEMGEEAPGLEPEEGEDVEASSGQREEPTPEEALMGMAPDAAQGIPGPFKSLGSVKGRLTKEQYFARVKALKGLHKTKAIDGGEMPHDDASSTQGEIQGMNEEATNGAETPPGFDHEHKNLTTLATLARLRKDLMGMGAGDQEGEEELQKRLSLISKIKKIESLVTDKAEEIPGKESEIITGQTGKKSQPSEHTDLTPEKAGRMLEENEANGEPLTKKQRGFFGAVRGKKDKKMSKKSLLQERVSLRNRWKAIKQLHAKHLDEVNQEKSLISSMYKGLESKQDMKSVQEKQWLHKRFKALEKNLDPYSQEKTYIVSRFKDLNYSLKKEYNWEPGAEDKKANDTVKAFAKKFNSNHKNLLGEARKFLTELKSVSPMAFGDPHRQEAYHLSKCLHQIIGDVCGKGSVQAGLQNLAKTLVTEEMPAEVGNKPKGPSKYNPNGEPMQQWEESESVVKGKKNVSYEFPELAKEREEVNVEHPNSNPQAKPHDEHMPYHEGEHLPIGGVNAKGIGERGSFPEMCEEDGVVNLTDPKGPSKYSPGKEPLQQWKETLVKGLQSIGQTANFFKMLSYKKDFGDDDQEMAGKFVLILAPIESLAGHLGMEAEEGLEGLEEGPFGMDEGLEGEWMEEEMEEPEHADIANEMGEEMGGEGTPGELMEEEEGEEENEEEAAHPEAPGEIGEKKQKSLAHATTKEGSNGKMPKRGGMSEKDLNGVMTDNMHQTQTLLNLQQSLQNLLSRLPN
jgi:hypothetical protein